MSDDDIETSENEESVARQFQEDRLTARQQMMREVKKSKTESAVSAARQAEELAARLKRIQRIWRTTNIASGVTLIGLIVTFISMNLQLILGNGLKWRLVPPLHLVEILILGVVYFIIAIQALIYLTLFTILAGCVSSPTGALTCAGKVIEEVTSVLNTAPIQESFEAGIESFSGMVAD